MAPNNRLSNLPQSTTLSLMLLRVFPAVLFLTTFAAAQPDFGPNVFLFNPKLPTAQMQATIDRVYAQQQHSEFGPGRYAFLLMPGEYKLDIPIGFYTEVAGLGASPNDTHITGNVHVDAASRNNNATTTFWRAAEGFSVSPTDDATLRWATSQAVSFRRMHVLGNMRLHQNGWASGGWLSDSLIDGNVDSGPQQQWISRNAEWKSWTGSNWNMVFVGVPNPPAGEWPKPAYTKVALTPVIREKPFIISDSGGNLSVRIPALTHNTSGITWHRGSTPGHDIPLSRFYIAHSEKDSAVTLNAALASGKHLLLTPGTYNLDRPLRVTHKDSVVLGLGYATLHPTRGTAALTLADADGIIVAGLLFDAGETESTVLLEVGDRTSSTRHLTDPISLHDIFFRVGGAAVGKTLANLTINSNDVVVDHTWIWRADHGAGVGWTSNTSANGLIVNGSDATIYGLFVEHHQRYQVLWNGERGRTYFYQSEIPYDPPTQTAWTDSQTHSNGYASYKVGDSVQTHHAFGLGIYSVFRHPDVILNQAIAAPERPTVRFEHMVTVALDNLGQITHIVNETGPAATTHQPRVDPRLTLYPPARVSEAEGLGHP